MLEPTNNILVYQLKDCENDEEIEECTKRVSIEGIREMLDKDPVDLALRMVTMREAVANHEKLRRRVSSLD